MTPRHRRAQRLAAAGLAFFLLAAGPLLPAAADDGTPRTYNGPAYSPDFPAPPTEKESQSKLWFHAGAWWALLLEPAGRTVRVFELMPDHSWRPTSAVVTTDAADTGDALRDGDLVHVVSRRSDASLHYVRLTFDPAARDYRADPSVLVPTRGSAQPAVIAKDTTGRLWVAFTSAVRTVVTYSDDGGQSWARNMPVAIRETGETPEAVAIVSYDDRIGLLWSDQTTGSFEFASHRDGDLPTVWSREQALVGPAQADDHISLLRVRGEPADTLVAAVKTSRGDEGEPPDSLLIEVLIRTPDGRWSAAPVSTIAEGYNEPIVQVDETTRTLHVFASRDGSIVTKRTSLDDIRFEPGIGALFAVGLDGELADPTSSKDPVDARSGLVVLASDSIDRAYRHAELPLTSATPTADPADQSPPNPPGNLTARALSPESVVLSWDEATDGNQWAPARNGVPAQQYVLLRDGAEVATLTSTSTQDQPRAGGDPTSAVSINYAVQAVDSAGNRSAPVGIVVDLPGAPPGPGTATIVGIGLLPLAAIAGLVAIGRRFLTRG
ncbi:hypothetical protein FHU33_4577 [Blastococcus colisei]|uniref:Fibronectin type-III domain-containing protein n=1 Tax=Blastococcus colisei TaxID=1564162 RepID=A0A543P1A8_9ACTN|nr:hypothetical protein [Blastococcus colisei]TQN37904.1 hypothetical protein FHU33_4577 [Blastococcus colisei]